MADEALACFTSLLENVPGWIADLESVLKRAADRQEEMLFANQPAGSTPVPSPRKVKSKSSSMRSMSRESREQDGGLNAAQHPQAKHFTSSDALRLSQRKRKTASACSWDHSGPVKSRVKAAAVVYYDGDTQKQFERIVRTVSASRNSIRKGKMSAKMESLIRTGSSCSESSSNSGAEDEADEFSPVSLRLNFKSTRTPRILSRRDHTEAFDKLDGFLEKAQSSCERAAHQLLREGDCTQDIDNAKEQFLQALKLSEAEVPVLQRKAVKAAERRRRSEERRRAEEEVEERRKSARRVGENIIKVVTAANPGESKLNVDDLEVDDDSDDSDAGVFNVGAMRGTFGTYARMRSSRLTAH